MPEMSSQHVTLVLWFVLSWKTFRKPHHQTTEMVYDKSCFGSGLNLFDGSPSLMVLDLTFSANKAPLNSGGRELKQHKLSLLKNFNLSDLSRDHYSFVFRTLIGINSMVPVWRSVMTCMRTNGIAEIICRGPILHIGLTLRQQRTNPDWKFLHIVRSS